MFLSEKLGVRGKGGDQKKDAPSAQPQGDQWVQKSVLLQREEKGFGFRLSGSCPAQVQSVRENSAAARAGVVPYDRIFKVNGTLVTGMKHEDVGRLIDSNSHVQLVLLHRVTSSSTLPPAQMPPSRPPTVDTSPASVDGVKRLAIVVEDDANKMAVGGSKHKKTPSLPESTVAMHQPPTDLGDDGDDDDDSRLVRRNSDSSKRLDTSLAAGGDGDGQIRHRARSQSMPYVAMTVKSRLLWALKGALSINDEQLGEVNDDQVDEAPSTGGVGRPAPVYVPFQEVQIMSVEDQELASDEHVAEQGPFSSFAELLQKPAHLSVFLHFLFCNSNPDAVLFYLVADSYFHGPTKEMKRWAYEIFSTFVAEGAPLQVALQPFIVCDMDEVLLYKSDKEDVMKNIFDQAKQYIEREIHGSLAEYRNKSLLGLDSMFGAHELSKLSGDKQEELMVAQKYLWQNFDRLSELPKKTDKELAWLWALATVLKDMGLSNIVPNPELLERTPSFACKDKKFKLARNSRKTVSLLDHQFQPQQFYAMTTCGCCQKVLWGIGCQGYQCSNCESCIHYECISVMSDKCQGKNKKRYSRSVTGVLGRFSGPVRRTPTGPQTVSPTYGSSVTYSQSMRDPSHHIITTDDDSDERGIHRKVYDSPAADSLEEDSYFSDEDATMNSDLSRAASDVSRSTVSSAVSDNSLVSLRSLEDDKDLEIESDMPPLEVVIPKDVLKKLKPKEKKRQEVINELFYTEANHVRNLRVLQKVFYQPLSKYKFPDRLLEHVFPNLDDVHRLHANLSTSFKERRKENIVVGNVGDLLLATFGGEAGFRFRSAMAKFCGNQVHAGNLLRQRQRNDQKFAQILQELNSNALCRRLELKDLLPTIMQRLTKYPLLIENLLKYSQPDSIEYKNLQKALECSKDTLAYVNKEVRECENRQRLEDIQSRLDTSSMPKDFAMIDLRERKLLHHGTLVWKINAGRLIDVYMLLLDTHIVLLERKETRYILRQQNAAIGADQFLYSPVVDLPGMIVRLNAGDAKAFFLIKVIPAVKSTEESGGSKKKAHSQIYELIAGSKDEHKTWVKNIEAAISAQPKGAPVVAPTIRTVAPPVQPPLATSTNAGSPGIVERPAKEPVTPISNVIVAAGATVIDDEDIEDIVRQRESEVLDQNKSSSSSTGSLDMAHAETFEGVPQLIHPTEVVKNNVFVGGGVTYGSSGGDLTLAEKLRREHEVMAHALHTKRKIIGEMFNVPETNYHDAFENVDDDEVDPLACLLEDSRLLTSLCSRAETCTRRMPVRTDGDQDDGAAAADADDQAMRVCMELDYDSMVALMERFNNHLMQLLDDRVATDDATAPNKSLDSSRSPAVSSTKKGLTSIDRQDEVMRVEPQRHELRIKGRQRDSYMTAVELSPEPEVATYSFDPARSQKLATLNEWTPNVETDQYDVVCDVDVTIS